MPKVLWFPVKAAPQVLQIAAGLEPMQSLVGGYIEHVTLENGVGLICNEDGKQKNLPLNRRFDGINDVIRGPFFISRYDDEGETIDVTAEDVKKYSKEFA